MGNRAPTHGANPSAGRRLHGDDGSAVVEVAILAPVFLLLLAFVVFVGRIGSLSQVVTSAARDASRAASLRGSTSAADADANDVVASTMSDHGVSCQDLRVDVDTSRAQPGGTVIVTVTCTVSLSGLTGFPLPGDKSVSARSVQVIDRYGAAGS